MEIRLLEIHLEIHPFAQNVLDITTFFLRLSPLKDTLAERTNKQL